MVLKASSCYYLIKRPIASIFSLQAETNKIVDGFMKQYPQMKYYYEELMTHAQELCETSLLDHSNVQSYITGRLKSSESLRQKLSRRIEGGARYKDTAAIKADIVDIVGIRISYYFPSSASAIRQMIRDSFVVVQELAYPAEDRPRRNHLASQGHEQGYSYKFPGYSATHYRVRLPRNAFEGYENEVFEIQVVSALAHVWAEVEHDIAYKVLINPTSQQHRMLDTLNGLVRTGEVILDQIQQLSATHSSSYTHSERFENKYQLGEYLLRHLPQVFVKRSSISVLYRFLCNLQMNSAADLEPRLLELKSNKALEEYCRQALQKFQPFDPDASVYIMDHILSGIPEERFEDQARATRTGASANRDDFMYDFKVVINSLIWLWRLFPSNGSRDYIHSQIINHFREDKRTQSLKWMLESVVETNILLQHPPGSEDREKLQTLRRVFESSSQTAFQFAFKISRIGVWKELPDCGTQLAMMRLC